ncbi:MULTISPECIES: GIY-YIG nuclease family protein [Marinobacter]|uniref:Putative endonuclease n=1 Tax=Marinobacter segnicrescens TaxID=430453 RepID=A0A1I0C6Q2_9GAMM|nr:MULTISPECIES: GIY-YIG nuclease family protein [Marinobacter]UZD64838.1 GIY-YIG nuclease family protein [Marinobacter sp. AN1]SET15005.1 putative endonuclease [Marinobacter segnicrescens]
MADWHLYIIRTAGNTLYTGVTTDVNRRFTEHCSGGPRCARSLRGRGPLELVFSQAVGNRSRALRLEWYVKRWPRRYKDELISGHRGLEL